VFELEVAAKRYALTPPEHQLTVSGSLFSPQGLETPIQTNQEAVNITPPVDNPNTALSPLAPPAFVSPDASTSFDDTFHSARGPSRASLTIGRDDSPEPVVARSLLPNIEVDTYLPELDISSVGSSQHELSISVPDASFLTALDISRDSRDEADNDDDDNNEGNALITSLAALSFAAEPTSDESPGIESSTPTSNGNAISEWLRRSKSASKHYPQDAIPVTEPLLHVREEVLTEIPMRTSLCLQVGLSDIILSYHMVSRLVPSRFGLT
jgi:hypothetical protein